MFGGGAERGAAAGDGGVAEEDSAEDSRESGAGVRGNRDEWFDKRRVGSDGS